MNVYITKLNGLPIQDTSQYIQWMTAEIAHQLGFREMGIYRYNGASESQESFNGRLDGIIAGIDWGNDVVVCQFPTGNGLKYEHGLVSRLKLYRSKIVIFIHDPDDLIQKMNSAVLGETVQLYDQADVLIVPSLAMRQFLLDHGIKREMKFIIQEMWDYTTDMNFYDSPKFCKEIHFLGSSSFDGMSDWNRTIPLKLYVDSESKGRNVHNMGRLTLGELLSVLSKGGFGLVWYQDEESRRCMEYGISFSLGQYLAAGIPVIVPAGISNQTLIEKNHLGVVADSLDEALAAVESMTESEYQRYVWCIRQFAPALRKGYYTKKCLIDAVQAVCRQDAVQMIMPAGVYELGEEVFTYTVLNESHGDNLALSWSYRGEVDGFLVYDVLGKLIYETRNVHQHYFLVKGYAKESGFIIKAYIDTLKGKLIVAESEQIYLQEKRYDHAGVSLIIPAYNAQDCIARSIDIVLAQSFSDLEIIVVDDGSTDHTADIADWYAEKYSNVIVIHQGNGGVGVARNAGIKCAGGEYIGFMDSDDMIHPDMITRLYSSVKKNDCDIAITSIYRVEESGHKIFVQYPLEEDSVISGDDFFQMHFDKGLIFSVMVWNKLYRASLVKERLLPEFFLGEDGAWTPCILSYADRICYRNDLSYEYDRVIRKSTLESQWMSKAREERFEMYKNIVTFYLKNGNVKRRRFLKMLAKSNLLGWGRMYGDSEYKKLWEEIDKIF